MFDATNSNSIVGLLFDIQVVKVLNPQVELRRVYYLLLFLKYQLKTFSGILIPFVELKNSATKISNNYPDINID